VLERRLTRECDRDELVASVGEREEWLLAAAVMREWGARVSLLLCSLLAACHLHRHTASVPLASAFAPLRFTRSHYGIRCASTLQQRHYRGLLHLAKENSEVRRWMETLVERVPVQGDWKKTRNYLYRLSHSETGLTVSQIEAVIACLSQELDGQAGLVAHVLQQAPRILRKNTETFTRPTISFLRDLYGQEVFLEAIRRRPDLLLTQGVGYNAGSLQLVEVYLQEDLGMPKSTIKALQNKSPWLFSIKMAQLLSAVDYIRGILERAGCSSGASLTTIRRLFIHRPRIIQLSVENNLQPRLQFLQDRLGLNETNMGVWFQTTNAALLGLSVQDNLAPTLDYLEQLVGNKLKEAVLMHPSLIGLSLYNLQEKVAYFNSVEGIDSTTLVDGSANINTNTSSSNSSQITTPSTLSSSPPQSTHKQQQRYFSRRTQSTLATRILQKCPAVYSLSLPNNIQPTIDFLCRVWTGYPMQHASDSAVTNTQREILVQKLKEYPTVLTLSLQGNLRPTVQFYNNTGYIQLDEDWNRIVHNTSVATKVTTETRTTTAVATCTNNTPDAENVILPGRYMAASLYQRLLPRWHYCKAHNKIVPLHLIASASDAAFCGALKLDLDAYLQFRVDAIPQLKFNSQISTWLATSQPLGMD
jgi:mTERF